MTKTPNNLPLLKINNGHKFANFGKKKNLLHLTHIPCIKSSGCYWFLRNRQLTGRLNLIYYRKFQNIQINKKLWNYLAQIKSYTLRVKHQNVDSRVWLWSLFEWMKSWSKGGKKENVIFFYPLIFLNNEPSVYFISNDCGDFFPFPQKESLLIL